MYTNETHKIKLELSGLLDGLENKLGRSGIRRLRSIVLNLLSASKEVASGKKIELSRDKKDNAYLNLCLRVRADFLLTGDKDLLEISPEKLKPSGLNRLKIVWPDVFLSESK
jgi:predicted nucleic acid-binding protein